MYMLIYTKRVYLQEGFNYFHVTASLTILYTLHSGLWLQKLDRARGGAHGGGSSCER